jgi:hypothetical protein
MYDTDHQPYVLHLALKSRAPVEVHPAMIAAGIAECQRLVDVPHITEAQFVSAVWVAMDAVRPVDFGL